MVLPIHHIQPARLPEGKTLQETFEAEACDAAEADFPNLQVWVAVLTAAHPNEWQQWCAAIAAATAVNAFHPHLLASRHVFGATQHGLQSCSAVVLCLVGQWAQNYPCGGRCQQRDSAIARLCPSPRCPAGHFLIGFVRPGGVPGLSEPTVHGGDRHHERHLQHRHEHHRHQQCHSNGWHQAQHEHGEQAHMAPRISSCSQQAQVSEPPDADALHLSRQSTVPCTAVFACCGLMLRFPMIGCSCDAEVA